MPEIKKKTIFTFTANFTHAIHVLPFTSLCEFIFNEELDGTPRWASKRQFLKQNHRVTVA